MTPADFSDPINEAYNAFLRIYWAMRKTDHGASLRMGQIFLNHIQAVYNKPYPELFYETNYLKAAPLIYDMLCNDAAIRDMFNGTRKSA